MEEQLGALQRSIQNGQNDLAALRYTLLDGFRVTSQVSHGRAQTIRQGSAGVVQLALALASSPLFPAQRRMVNSLQNAVEGWIETRSTVSARSQFPLDSRVFQTDEFSLSEVTQAAFQAIQQAAAGAGIDAQTAISANVPETALGDAGHIGQLVTLLPESLLRFVETRGLGVQVSVEPNGPGFLRIESATASIDKWYGQRDVRAFKRDRHTLQVTHAGRRRLERRNWGSPYAGSWRAPWAARSTSDASTDKDVRLQLVLPVAIPSPAGVSAPAAAPLAGVVETPGPEGQQ